jgi:heme/copper-type cytochrome/quinol oxidase subunit 2
MNFHRFVKFTASLAAFTAASAVTALAQCAMCKANVANAENAAEVSTTINAAVLVLLIPTLLVIGGVARLVFKYRHSPTNSYVHFRSSDTQRNFE